MAEESEESKKKGGFFSKLMKIAFIAAIVGAVVGTHSETPNGSVSTRPHRPRSAPCSGHD